MAYALRCPGEKEGAHHIMSPLPEALATVENFFLHLGVGAKERAFLERWGYQRYSVVEIPKRRGGTRILTVPDARLKFLQRKVLSLLEPLYSPRKPVHGFVKGRGAVSNANAHQGRPYLLNLDLKDFFDSVSRRRVHGMLEWLGLNAEVATAICTICMVGARLPQGAPTSPLLANMISYRMDRQLMSFAAANRMRYTRYADDISFSSYTIPSALFEIVPASGRVAIEQLSFTLRGWIASNDFEIHPEKVWFSDRGSRKEVTGLTVNEFTNVKRNFVRDLRASLHKVETMTLAKAQEDFAARYDSKAPLESVLRGRLEWIAQVRGRSFGPYRSLAKRFNKLFPDRPAPIDPTYDEIAERAVWVVEFYLSEAQSGQGTAFFLRDIGFVTADHVLSALPDGSAAEAYLPQEPTKRFKVYRSKRRCAHRDLLILDHEIPINGMLELQLASSPDRTKDEITALGYSSFGPGDSLGQHPGKIVAKTTMSGVKLIEVSAFLSDGLSGGPVINERHQVVGVVHKGGATEPKQLAVHISELVALASETSAA